MNLRSASIASATGEASRQASAIVLPLLAAS